MKLPLAAIARHHDALAPSYDALGVDDPATYWRHTATNVVLTQADVEPDDVVLDLGCGTGNVALTIAPHVRRVVGVDCSGAMLDRARAKARTLGNVDLFTGDLRDSPTVPGLRVVTACYALHHLDAGELRSLARRTFGALAPGGLFVIGDLLWTVPPEHVEGCEGWLDTTVGYSHAAQEVLKLMEAEGFQVAIVPLHPVVSVLAALRP